MTRNVAAETALPHPESAQMPRRRWGWPHYLAMIGVPILFVHVWTIVAWIPDAHQVTQYRTPYSVNWWAARAYETLGCLIFIVVAVIVVRQCVRQHRFTFDAMLLLCGMTGFWADYGISIFAPAWLASSNWVNLNNPLGHVPGMVNPDVGRAPDPLLFTIPLESAGFVLGAWLICWLARRIKERRPNISTAKLVLTLFGIGLVLELLTELPIIAAGLWSYPAPSWMSVDFVSGFRFPASEWIAGGWVFLFFGLMRLFKDDKGRTIVERGLDHLPSGRRIAISLLAMYAATQLIMWGPSTWIDIAYVPYEQPWEHAPNYLLNETCDAPGVTGTRYGPCPGSPEFRMPNRASHLPGPNP